MSNPFEVLEAKLDTLTSEVRSLKNSRSPQSPVEDLGGLDMAVEITGLAPRTIYKKTHLREIPHIRKGGRLFFKRSELIRWIEDGRRPMASEQAEYIMVGNEKAGKR